MYDPDSAEAIDKIIREVCMMEIFHTDMNWQLRGLNGNYHLGSNLSTGRSERRLILYLYFASLPLEITQPIKPTMCTKVATKHHTDMKASCV